MSALRLSMLLALIASCAAPPEEPADPAPPDAGPRAPTEEEALALRDELILRGEEDQAVRRVDREALEGEALEAHFEHWREVDEANTARLREIVAEFGWPTISMVGEEASLAAFLLVQHADRAPEFQAECLPLLEEAAARGEVSAMNLAYLTDRVRKAQGRPQLYGTQYSAKMDENGEVVTGADGRTEYLLPLVEDMDGLDERRAAAGLGPWAEYERHMAEIQGREPAERPRAAPPGE